jgi:plasmid stability protein
MIGAIVLLLQGVRIISVRFLREDTGGTVMTVISIGNLPDDIYCALKERAELNGRSMEAEVLAILEDAIRPEPRMGMGDALASLGRKIGIKNDDPAVLKQVPAEPVKFE